MDLSMIASNGESLQIIISTKFSVHESLMRFCVSGFGKAYRAGKQRRQIHSGSYWQTMSFHWAFTKR